ncbi:hypothetical protein [Clostridium sardiniense]|uniref:hypothetical protein n=1 Tax=Clostridium sardiniense TaxID=29369 RepID=UPI003D3387BC
MSKDKIEDLNEFLEFNINSFITSGEIANRLDIKYAEAKIITKELYRYDYLDLFFRQYCENEIDICETNTYDSIESIPDEFCEDCDKKCQIIKNIMIVYKVLKFNVYE